MKPLKKVAALAVVLIGILSFSIKETNKVKPSLNLDEINIDELLSSKQFECRPDCDFTFNVETELIKKVRGGNNINAKVYITEKSTGKTSLLSQENIQIKKYKDAIAIEGLVSGDNFKNTILENGDKIIGSSNDQQYAFEELIKNETIYNSYINATNELLRLKRSI
ncbi:hypothetical protein BW723_04910 [Polaribacter reichenbachii]|uniref:Uncharacterized protein n=1 Tax=Polaribacter reichenbachii TaxID=996801 RepID=A0A1B8TU49_9FLAO|nr:hypothetical protein [Polaribacter reichenbachii]APZ45678.1 hypothetical protein BW723_04910 [Polaribacter reichenbachii]AUC19540.1 hypothetical protein BTO17_12920 [Polaribacter reichenbachii]OBY63306.1 hypothetical protein LPB301_10800 [Polaribacter reichenbachii]